MGKRIAITGAHGDGKTTLAKALSETLGLPLITERAREEARNMGIGHCRELVQDRALAWKFQEEVLEAQIRAQAEKPDGFVSDRSTLDCIAYFRLYQGDRVNGPEKSRYYYRARFHAWRKLDWCTSLQLWKLRRTGSDSKTTRSWWTFSSRKRLI